MTAPTAPRLEVDYPKIEDNARELVRRLGERGISVTGVTKAALGNPLVADAMLRGGVIALGDSREANLRRLAQCNSPTWLIRSPMISEVEQVVSSASLSCNTELDVLDALSLAAQARGVDHRVMLMIELGDRREGIMPADLFAFIDRMRRMPAIVMHGVGVNLACASGVAPDKFNMAELSAIAGEIETQLGIRLPIVSGGNSANLLWAAQPGGAGRVNNLRLGEAILLGCEALHRQPVMGLHTDAFSLVAEVIEAKRKPVMAYGTIGQSALGGLVGQVRNDGHAVVPPASTENRPVVDRHRNQAIVAIGAQDVDPDGLTPPAGIAIISASSDHLVVDTGKKTLRVGDELSFGLNYSALLRAMTSPFVCLVSRRVVHTEAFES
ncbi:MAG: alanine/ornithine racemase family PLP-dependent enzyme [Burkholderiaceae bacterium]